MQIGLRQSRKPCLNWWPRRLHNLRRNLIMRLIPLLLKQLYVLLGKGLINCRILFLKMLELFELRIDIPRLLQKKRVFEKVMFKVKTGHIV